MLLALHQRQSLRQFLEAHAWMRVLGGHGLMAKIDGDAVVTWLADDPGEQHGRREKGHVREPVGIAEIP